MGEDVPANPSSLASALSNVVPDEQCRQRALEALQWFGLAPSSAKADKLPPLPTKPVAPVDLLTVMLTHKLRYGPGERYPAVLSHEIVAQPASVLGEASPDETEGYREYVCNVQVCRSPGGLYDTGRLGWKGCW